MISALIGNITHGCNGWIIDSGASKNMKIFKESFVKLLEHESPHKVKLGDDYQYPIKGSGESSYKLESMIGEQEGGLYKLKGHPEQALIHDIVEPNDLWHRRLAHVHYRALPIASNAVEGLPEFQAI